MAARKRPPKLEPAELRTLGLFTGRTPLEEAEAIVREEDPFVHRAQAAPSATAEPKTGRAHLDEGARASAVRWLGEPDPIGRDDVRIVTSAAPGGPAVLILGTHGVAQVKLSRKQWAKLKALVKAEPD